MGIHILIEDTCFYKITPAVCKKDHFQSSYYNQKIVTLFYLAKMGKMLRVVITGMGIISPFGNECLYDSTDHEQLIETIITKGPDDE